MANWVSAGCGVIANELAQAMEKRGQKLYGVVNRTQEKAVAFAEKYGVQKVYTSLEEACEILKRNTRRFAKRQLTWFRNRMEVKFYAISAPHFKEQVLADVKEFLQHD